MQSKERILELGTSTGHVRISRSRRNSSTVTYYLECEPTETAYESEEWLRVVSVGPFPSLEDALATLARDGLWTQAMPTYIHREFRTRVSQLVDSAVATWSERERNGWSMRDD